MAKNRILVIDDDENISKVIRLYLEKEGMEALLASCLLYTSRCV